MAEETTLSLAVLVDFENLALGFVENGKGRKQGRMPGQFEIRPVLERLVEKGKILVKIAYADWTRFSEYRAMMHEAGLQLMEIPERGVTGKNFADMQLCVDAMDMCYAKEHVDTFVIVSGDSDFTPLVSKLKENGKAVIGIGMKNSTSDLLASSCDEFIYYDDLVKAVEAPKLSDRVPKKQRPGYELMIEAIEALQRENVSMIQASLVKDTMMRKRPSFSESSYGFRSFQAFLEQARDYGLINLRRDQRSGTYVVET